jgi:hypothetical protein
MVMAYDKEEIENVFNIITGRIECGESLRAILKDSDMPSTSTFYIWLDSDKKKSKQYARATSIRADILFDEIINIADTTEEGVVIETDDHGRTKEKKGDMLGHRKLQIDARKWILSKLNPKKYGDKIDHTSDGKELKGLTIEWGDKKIDV